MTPPEEKSNTKEKNPDKKQDSLKNKKSSEERQDLAGTTAQETTETENSETIDSNEKSDTVMTSVNKDLTTPEEKPNEKNILIIQNELSKLPGIENILEPNLLKDIKNIPSDTLFLLEDTYPGLLFYMFVKTSEGQFHPNQKITLSPGDKLTIDFLGNESAYWNVGIHDILPGYIRKISTMDTEGNKRTSERRIGYKGTGEDGVGFFDTYGYMPILDEFQVIIENNDKNIDSKSLENEDSYNKTHPKQEEEDKKYLETKSKENPTYSRKKTASGETYPGLVNPEQQTNLISGITNFIQSNNEYQNYRNEPGLLISAIATYLIKVEKDRNARHCGDWVKKVYYLANLFYPERNLEKDSTFKNKSYLKGETPPPPRNPLYEPVDGKIININMIKPGSHLYYWNGNQYELGLHSAIFIKWLDPQNKIAQCASFPGNGNPASLHKVNFGNKKIGSLSPRPIVRVANPRY